MQSAGESITFPSPRHCLREEKEGDFWTPPPTHRVRAAAPRDSPPPPAASAAGGWGSPVPACTDGRVGQSACRRRPGGGGAGGGLFGAGVFFSGGGAPWGTASTRAACWSSRPGVVLEFLWFPSDLQWRRIGRPVPGGARVLQRSTATDPKAAGVWRRCWARGASAMAVHRQELRRGAAGSLGGVFQGTNYSQAVARRRLLLFVFVAGEADDLRACSGSSPSYLFFLCFFYVLCMWIPGEYTW